MTDPSRVIEEFFARRRKVHLIMPDGWVGRPYDDWYGLVSTSVDGDELTIELDTKDTIVVPRTSSIRDVGRSVLIALTAPATFHQAGIGTHTYRDGMIELVGVGSEAVRDGTDDER
jgi:hypothetical protein